MNEVNRRDQRELTPRWSRDVITKKKQNHCGQHGLLETEIQTYEIQLRNFCDCDLFHKLRIPSRPIVFSRAQWNRKIIILDFHIQLEPVQKEGKAKKIEQT